MRCISNHESGLVYYFDNSVIGSGKFEVEFNTAILTEMNAERTKRGLKPFKLHSKLIKSAQGQADDMAKRNKLDHFGANGSTWYDRCKAAGYEGADSSNIGENAAAGQTSAKQLVADWMTSPGHRAPILSTKYIHIGSGYSVSTKPGYKYFWCTDFGYSAPDDEQVNDLGRDIFDFL